MELDRQIRERVERIEQDDCKLKDLILQFGRDPLPSEDRLNHFKQLVREMYDDVQFIRSRLAKMPAVEVDSEMEGRLKKIRDGYGYSVFLYVEMFRLDQRSEEVALEEDGYMFDHSWVLQDHIGISYHELSDRRRKVGALIVRDELPAHLLDHFARVRDCFALGRYHAAIIYCRALLEAACRHAISSRGLSQTRGSLDNDSLSDMLSTLRNDVYRNLLEGAYSTKQRANDLIHSPEAEEPSQDECLEIIRDTIAFVEDMFRGTANAPAH